MRSAPSVASGAARAPASSVAQVRDGGAPGVEPVADRRAGSPRRRRPRRARADRSPTAPGSVSPIASTAFAYSSERVMSETVVSSVERVTGTPARCRRASGWAASARHDPGLHVRGRAEVQRHAAVGQLGAERRVVDRAGTVGDPLRVHRERAAHLRGAAPLPGVERDPQAARPRGLERRGVQRRDPGRRPPARRGPSRSAPGRGSGPRSRRGRGSRPGRASAARCR